MPKKQGELVIGKPAPAWMQTFADLMTQLLIFFVLFFALSTASAEEQLEEIKQKVDSYVKEKKVENFVNTNIDEKGLVISLQNKLMFNSGKADIFNEAKVMLNNLTAIIMKYPNKLKIEGHTDNVPIKTEEFPSNWELSTARATNVTRYILEKLKFPPEKLSSAGFAEYHPVVPNDTPMNRALNRRVDLVVSRVSIEQMKEIRKMGKINPFDDSKKSVIGEQDKGEDKENEDRE